MAQDDTGAAAARVEEFTTFLKARIAEDKTGTGTAGGRAEREAAAKQIILTAHIPVLEIRWNPDGTWYTGAWCSRCRSMPQWPCLTLRAISGVYSDHPRYQREWVP